MSVSNTVEPEISNDSSGWGWENIGETHSDEPQGPSHTNESDNTVKFINEIKPVKSLKSFDSKQIALKVSADSLKSGMTSSPSFQELERAIGATLAQSMNGSETELPLYGRSMATPKVGTFNSIYNRVQAQQKLQARQKLPVNPKLVKEGLHDFIRESESRALILFHSPDIQPNVIRDACQKIGALYYIRPEFRSRGVTFISYFDLRSAVTAVHTIHKELGPIAQASAHYSIMLHGTTNNCEEHKLVVRNLPTSIVESELESVFSRYGEVRSIERKQISDGIEDENVLRDSSYIYLVEYFNIEDSRSAASELCATCGHIWGPNASVSFCPLTQHKQTLLRQLLGILSRWRNELAQPINSQMSYRPNTYYPPLPSSIYGNGFTFVPNSGSNDSGDGVNISNSYTTFMPRNPLGFAPISHGGYSQLSEHSVEDANPLFGSVPPIPYSVGITNTSVTDYRPAANLSGVNEDYYSASTPQQNLISKRAPQQMTQSSTAYRPSDTRPQHHNGLSQTRRTRVALSSSPAEAEFALDLTRIENHSEVRTTVMVRNIPNKYTQRMLLDEVDVKHRGTYDFFYLPIDFKNRCNVGYCFINFLDPSYIVSFVEEFNGHRWKNFNSEKVCAVSFARIQGKAAMIARFQNSSLLEKNDEYKPLLFYSSGPEKGKPEPFPSKVKHSNGSKDAHSYYGNVHNNHIPDSVDNYITDDEEISNI